MYNMFARIKFFIIDITKWYYNSFDIDSIFGIYSTSNFFTEECSKLNVAILNTC